MVFLHQTTTLHERLPYVSSCFLWCSYIKPQRRGNVPVIAHSCFLWCSYIKPQLIAECSRRDRVVSYGVPTSNHNSKATRLTREFVVSYGVPTSNHNTCSALVEAAPVVSYGVPTSNHNPCRHSDVTFSLFLMVFLHQTTTESARAIRVRGLFLMVFLHQTTTCSGKIAFYQHITIALSNKKWR